MLMPPQCLRRRPLALLLAGLLLAACTPRQPHPLPEPPDIPFGQGRLWQVEGAAGEPSYLFAIVRAGDKRLTVLPEAAQSAFDVSDVAAFDTLRDPLTSESFYDVERLKLPEGQTLQDLIGARSFGTLTWHMKRSELRPKDNIKPWAFWLYLGGTNWGFFDYRSYFDHRYDTSFDTWLASEARRSKKEVLGLLSDQESFALYNEMPLEQQADLLKLELERYSESMPEVSKVQIYLDGNLATLDALWREYLSWLPPQSARALDERLVANPNRLMVERMIPLMQKAPTFVAVDALHVPGEQGILRLLEQRGFTVTRLH
jgi:hypothetical protein